MKVLGFSLALFLAIGGGFLAGHLAASIAVATTWLEVDTRTAAATKVLDRLEKSIAQSADTQTLEPNTVTAPPEPAQETNARPMEIQFTRVRQVARGGDRQLIFGWEVRVSNSGATPIRIPRALFYLVSPQGEPLRSVGDHSILLRPGCSQVIRGIVQVHDYCYHQPFDRVMISETESDSAPIGKLLQAKYIKCH